MGRNVRWPALTALAATVVLVAGCGGSDSEGGDGKAASSEPISIGTSLPLTGQFSAPGTAAKQGYETWAELVNQDGGMLGRKVDLTVLDDASNQNTVISDFNRLISGERVDFVIGTFSTRLALPASAITERRKLLYVDPAGAAPQMFERGYKYYFYAEPAPPWEHGAQFGEYVASLPEAERPKTVAYVYADDPFASSTVDGIRQQLEAAGVKSVLDAKYAFAETNFDPIAARIKASGAEVVVHGSGVPDGIGLVRAMAKAGAKPGLLYQSNAPGYAKEYPAGVGAENTDGVFYPAGYNAELDTPGNAEFVAAYQKKFQQPPTGLAAFAFAAAQVLHAAVEGVGEKGIKDQTLLADWLRANSVDTVLGPMRWDERGEPQGDFTLGQWQDGKQQIVLPADLATSDTILRCYRDC